MIDTTSEIEDRILAEYILFYAKEMGEWKTFYPNAPLANEDDPWGEVRIGNVDFVDYYGDGRFEMEGSFTTAVVVERIRGSYHHPPEVRTRNGEGRFHIVFHMEDGGHADGEIEVW